MNVHKPPALSLVRDEPGPSNTSIYTLNTLDDDASDTAPLLTPATPNYGATFPRSPNPTHSSARVIFNATLKMACIFAVSTLFLGGTLWLALPTLDEADRPLLRIPKSFVQLQALNGLLKKYRISFLCRPFRYRIHVPVDPRRRCLGRTAALPLACCCVATGATLCYLISAALGPALLTLPKWKAVLDKWGNKIRANKENMISFLIVLRIAPLPPHWVVNLVCPHVGIGIVPFWISTALGIMGVSVIHTTIGGGLDQMTSADDFHLISWRNFLGLAAVVVGVMIPVGLRYWFRREGVMVSEEEEEELAETGELLDGGWTAADGKKKRTAGERGFGSEPVYSSSEEDDDGDVILEAGPSIFGKEPAR
ncbi:hypothetical protein BJ912DRAFT_949210 [Pholiota molesta]|nr:hypothetical protein BJ912DRAFT_949210 [Pholiota molesta]